MQQCTWLLVCKGQTYAGLSSYLTLITLHSLFNSSLSIKYQWCKSMRSTTFWIAWGFWCSYSLFPVPQAVCLAVMYPTDEADKAWQQLSNLWSEWAQYHKYTPPVYSEEDLVLTCLFSYIGLFKQLSRVPVFCLQAELSTPRYMFCLDAWPPCCRKNMASAFKACNELSE